MWRRTPARAPTFCLAQSARHRLRSQKAVIVPALGIHSVEARHAAWIRFMNSALPAPEIIDKPATEKAVLKAVTATGFIKG